MQTWQILTIIAIISITLEIFVPSFVFFPLGVGLLISAILSIWFPDPPEIIFISAVSIFLFFVLMRYLFKLYIKQQPESGILDKYVDQQVLVIKKVSSFKKGEVQVFGEKWSAISHSSEHDFMIGDHAVVKQISGNKLVIAPCE